MRSPIILGCLVCVTLGLGFTAAPPGPAMDTPVLRFSTLVMQRFAQLRATIVGAGDEQSVGCN